MKACFHFILRSSNIWTFIYSLVERISFMVIPFPWCLALLWKWSMIRSVTWDLLGRNIGCLTSKSKVESSSPPPTLISPSLSIKGSNFRRELCLEILAFCSLWLKLAISFLKAVRCISLKICLLTRRLVVQPLLWRLSWACSSWRVS